jgi:DNA-binding LacI/PurR family transcriptional regulator
MKSAVTMREIAARAGVSVGTVSHVINGTAGVREPLRQRVLAAINKLGYQPSQLGRALRRNQTAMLGMIIPDVTNPFFPAVVRGVEDIAYKHSYRLVLCNTDNDPAKEASYLNELCSYRPAGLLLIPAAGSRISAQLRLLVSTGPPAVCVDRRPADWQGDSVVVANERGAHAAARHLLEHGHRCIAVICGPRQLTNAAERLNGFRGALQEAGVALPAEYVQEARFDRQSGYQAALRLLRMLPRPTAIFACNDLMALGVLLAARELNLRCPQDLSIVGFDSFEFDEFTEPTLTSVYQPGYQLGAAAATLLMERIHGLTGQAKSLVLLTELKCRASSGPPPKSWQDREAEPASRASGSDSWSRRPQRPLRKQK